MAQEKVLFWDLETAGVNALKPDLGFIICFGYKWLNEKSTHVLTLKRDELRRFDDKRLLIEASRLIGEADITVAHYGSMFDRKFLQGRLLIQNLPAIPPTKLRDTWQVAIRASRFSSNRLKYLAKILKLKHQKRENNWPQAWFQVMQGDMKALANLAFYCKGDVLVLEELYKRLLPYTLPTDLKSRLFAKKEIRSGKRATPCWIWTGSLRNGRYGHISLAGKSRVVHQVAYELFKGEIPKGLELDHLCSDTLCFNPEHLEPVTHKENMGRITRGNIAKKTCKRGHPFDRTRIRKRNGRPRRECSICVNMLQRKRYRESKHA